MGREIRRVPPNWEHPKFTADDAKFSSWIGSYRPLLDEAFDPALRAWLVGYEQWRSEHHAANDQYDDAPPDPSVYRPEWAPEEQTWYQVYETVSEGTPTSPPFATAEELVEWLVAHKDFVGDGPQPRERAEKFVRAGRVPSMVIGPSGVKMGIEAADEFK